MSEPESSREAAIVHTEMMDLKAPPALVGDFILTPERILDYYPSPVEGGVLVPGEAIYCRGEMGVSLLERVGQGEQSPGMIVLKVTTALGLDAPYTRDRIESNATFSMFEDWLLEENGAGTRLTKSWRDIECTGPEPFPLAETIKQSAIHESPQLVEAWNRATP